MAAWEEYSCLLPCNNEYLVFIHSDANYGQEAVIAAARWYFYSVASFICFIIWVVNWPVYGFIANEHFLPAIGEQHHGSIFIFITTKAEENWMQVAPITQLGAG